MHPKLQLLSQIYESSLEANKTLDFEALLKACFFKDLQEALSLLNHQQQVYFAYMCANSVKHLIKKEKASQEAQKCLDLILKSLKDPENMTTKQLRSAADDAYIADAAVYIAYIASYAAASYVANAAADSCYITADAAYAAIYAILASNNKSKQSQLHLSFLVQAINFKGF